MCSEAAAQAASVIALVGATCTGKSRFARLTAEALGCAVLSADAMQVYRGMDIGTGKAFDTFGGVPLFGIDLVEPSEAYSASLYQEYGRAVIDAELARGERVVVCGGSGFYIRAVLDDMDFAAGDQTHNPVRERYQALYEREGAQAVWDALAALDPASAAAVHPNNVKRVIRALEMHAEGESYATRAAQFSHIAPKYAARYIGFTLPREVLYERIEARVDAMIDVGLVAEVQGLLDAGMLQGSTARDAIGYKEIIAYLHDECTLDSAIAAIKQATRRYAKRQVSWFGRDERITWIDGLLPDDEKLALILELCEKPVCN